MTGWAVTEPSTIFVHYLAQEDVLCPRCGRLWLFVCHAVDREAWERAAQVTECESCREGALQVRLIEDYLD